MPGLSSPPQQKRSALALAPPLPYTTFPTLPGSAIVLLATRSLLPALLPRASGRWPALSPPPRRPALPTTAGRESGGAGRVPGVPPVGELLLSLASLPPDAAI